MSLDFQFISVVDKLQVTGVTDIEGAIPRTVRVTGTRGFQSAQRVEINDFGIDSFIVVSDTVLLVAPGDTLNSVPVFDMNIEVLSGELTSLNSVRLVFGPTKRTREVSGVQKLIQQVVKSLLSDGRSNRFDTSEGGDLLQSIGKSLSPSASAQISTALALSVSRTQEIFLAAQAVSTNLDATERLLSLELLGVQFNSASLEVEAQIRLVTLAGQSISVPLTL
jgi:hypothetical protein